MQSTDFTNSLKPIIHVDNVYALQRRETGVNVQFRTNTPLRG
ncbi:hypothetical protein [Azospirillum argentinense]